MPAQFAALADLLPEPLLLATDQGLVTAVNRATRRHFAGAIEPGVYLPEFAAPPAEAVLSFLRACARTREFLPGAITLPVAVQKFEPYRAEGALYTPRSGQEPSTVLLRLTPRTAAVSRFIALSTTIAQLNEELLRRRRYEVALHEQREHLQVTLASIGDAVIATDLDTNITLINASAEQLTGWKASEAVGQPLASVFRIISEETRLPVSNPVLQAIAHGTVVGLANHTLLIRKDGLEIAIADSAAPIKNLKGIPVGVVLVFRDVTQDRNFQRELQLRAEELEDAARRKDEYLAMLAHELRNPLAPLANAVYILKSPNANPAQRGEILDMMSRQLAHVTRLVGDLLDVGRVTHGKIQLQKEPIDLRVVVKRAVELARPMIEAHRHALKLMLPTSHVLVNVDVVRLTQVLSNLLDNACKYTPDGGTIEVECHTSGGAEIIVRDSGVGIEPELLPHIFELFRQGDSSLERSTTGLGIGLTLVRRLVELHDGSVTAYSQGKNTGSEFHVRIPKWQPQDQ